MTAYNTMYNAVLNRARQSGTWSTDRVKYHINRCQQKLYKMSKEWGQLENDTTATGVVGQSNYGLPSDFERPIWLELRDTNTYYKIPFVPDKIVLNSLMNNPSSNARPTSCCIADRQLWFDRTLDKAYTIYMRYIYTPSDLSADADETVFPADILEEYAFAMLMKELGRENEFKTSYALTKELIEEYADSDGRDADTVFGFLEEDDTISPYYEEKLMW